MQQHIIVHWTKTAEHFKIKDEVRACLELLEKLNESLSVPWDYMFNEAKKYCLKNGNLLVSKRYVTKNGYTLGLWIATQSGFTQGR